MNYIEGGDIITEIHDSDTGKLFELKFNDFKFNKKIIF
jgi:hypothetical protein